jgi:hypothetical protein
VAKFNSIRILLALAAQHDLEVHQMDVKTAFLNGVLDEEIYMEQPEGFIQESKEHMVCKLKKSLYGLKQAGRSWYQMIDQNFTQLGFQRTCADQCIYHLRTRGIITIVALYVDDLIILTNQVKALARLKEALRERFEMKDLGEVHFCLGVQIVRNRKRGTICLDQGKYIENMIKRFNMSECKPVGTPLDTNVKLTVDMSPKTVQERDEMEKVPYQSAIGSLMYAMLGTRPDLAYAVGTLSQFNANPGHGHWKAVKRIFRYLKGTAHDKLLYESSANRRVIGYSDADWASNVDDRRSITGYIFFIGTNAISWSSKKQPTVALSTTEAEYMSLTQATKEGIWICRLLDEIGFGLNGEPIAIYNDNQSCVALSKNSAYHARTKHIDIQHHFIRERVDNKEVEVKFCGTDDMVADIFTKGLVKTKHDYLCGKVGLVRGD